MKTLRRISALAILCVGALAFIMMENELHGCATFCECIIIAALVD